MGKELLSFEQAAWIMRKAIRTFTSIAFLLLAILLLVIAGGAFELAPSKPSLGIAITALSWVCILVGAWFSQGTMLPDVSDFYKEPQKRRNNSKKDHGSKS